METRQGKRLKRVDREEEPPSKHIKVDTTVASNSLQDGNQLVFLIVIRSLRCPRLLRKCRLVCKAWDDFASSQLRVVSTTVVTAYDQKRDGYGPKSFASLKRLNDGIKSGGALPSPFRKIALITSLEPKQLFKTFARYLSTDFILTELQLHGVTSSVMKNNLMLILKSQSKSLQVLTIDVHEGKEKQKTHDILLKIQFPSMNLKKLMLRSVICSFWKPLIGAIALHSKLELLHLENQTLAQVEELFRGINFQHVDTLELGSFNFRQHMKIPDLIRLKWPNLIRLKVSVGTEQDVTEIVSRLKESLEMLHINGVKIPLDDLPICPKLSEIRSKSGYNGQFLPEKFPKLNQIYSGRSLPWSDLANIVPHYGVAQVKIGLKLNSQHEESSACQFCNKWESWAKKFPRFKPYFQEHQARFCKVSTALRIINKTFPNTKQFSVADYSDADPAIAYSRRYYQWYCRVAKLPLGLFLQEVFPFQDFLELESLDLSSIVVHSQLVISSLSRIPKLKYLRIKKHVELTEEIVRKYLGHLKEIAFKGCTFYNPSGGIFVKKLRDLKGETEIPLVKQYCNCGLCNYSMCCCQDCHQYKWKT